MILGKQSSKWLPAVCLLFAGTLITSCKRDEDKLDKTTRQLIESLARTEMIRLDDSLKTICDSIYAATYEHIKDSLYTVRQAEIQQIISEE
jgi:hypothetical protein